MNENGKNAREEQRTTTRLAGGTLLAGESLRSVIAAEAGAPQGKGEERLSTFWRVFGGTLLSLAGLVAVTLYQQFTGSLNELRNEISRLAEARADYVKKDEFNSRIATVWTSVKELQAATAAGAILKERCAILDQQLKAAKDEHREIAREVQTLSVRLAAAEGRQAVVGPPKPHVFREK